MSRLYGVRGYEQRAGTRVSSVARTDTKRNESPVRESCQDRFFSSVFRSAYDEYVSSIHKKRM